MNTKNGRKVVDSRVCGESPDYTIYYSPFIIHYS